MTDVVKQKNIYTAGHYWASQSETNPLRYLTQTNTVPQYSSHRAKPLTVNFKSDLHLISALLLQS